MSRKVGSCLNMRMCHLHFEDNAAQNHYELLRCLEMMLRIPMNSYGFGRRQRHPGNTDLNYSTLMLRIIMLILRMIMLYILY
jgi:hypothetical protein